MTLKGRRLKGRRLMLRRSFSNQIEIVRQFGSECLHMIYDLSISSEGEDMIVWLEGER